MTPDNGSAARFGSRRVRGHRRADAVEQMTYDPSTGLYHAYDYKGQLILTDDDSDFSTPERKYSYDNQGRRKTEEIWYEASYHHFSTVVTTDFPVCQTCGCDGSGVFTAGEETLDGSSGNQLSTVDYIRGQGATVPGSSSAVHPATAATVGGGSLAGNSIIIEAYDTNISSPTYLYRCETISGSLAGTLDAGARRTREYVYDEYGKTASVPILFDMPDSHITNVQKSGYFTIITTNLNLTADAWDGREISLCRPAAAGDRVVSARIVETDTGADAIYVYDPGEEVYNALYNQVQGFIVLDLVDPNIFIVADNWAANPAWPKSDGGSTTSRFYDTSGSLANVQAGHWVCLDYDAAHEGIENWRLVHAVGTEWVGEVEMDYLAVVGNYTSGVVSGDVYEVCVLPYPSRVNGLFDNYVSFSGTWSEAPSFADGETKLTDVQGYFAHAAGALLIPDVNHPNTMFTITGASGIGGWHVTVSGDISGVAGSGGKYRILLPPGVSYATGALCAPSDLGKKNNTDGGSRCLWMGYRYDAPVVGVYVDPPGGPTLGVYGAQPGTNELGNYHCWNRVYSPYLGRWTTPDPAASPWWNLWDYVGNNPLQYTDATGLSIENLAKQTDLPQKFQSDCGEFWFHNEEKIIGNNREADTEKQSVYQFRITFESNGKCCKCERIRWVQFARITYGRMEGGKEIEEVEQNPSGAQNKSIHADKGWFVDTNKEGRPWYGAEGTSEGRDTPAPAKPAVLLDRPTGVLPGITALQWWLGKRPSSYIKKDFLTCAFCEDCGVLYGCLRFTIRFQSNGSGRLIPSLDYGPVLIWTGKDGAEKWNRDTTRKLWNEKEKVQLPEAK